MAEEDELAGGESGDARSPWSKPSVLLSGMFVLALLAGGIAFMILNGGNSTRHRAQANPPGKAAPQRSSSAPGSTQSSSTTACMLPVGSQAIPYASPPAGARWATVGSMEVPQEPSLYGPQRSKGVWNTCFAHNPVGALLAAMNLYAESTTGSATTGETYRHLAVHVPSAALRATDHFDDEGPVQYAGYKYDSYSPGRAEISLVIRGPQGKLGAFVTPMVWAGSDWKYLFPRGGVPSLEVIPDLTGYVPWSAF
jgi:hypothetical protein